MTAIFVRVGSGHGHEKVWQLFLEQDWTSNSEYARNKRQGTKMVPKYNSLAISLDGTIFKKNVLRDSHSENKFWSNLNVSFK